MLTLGARLSSCFIVLVAVTFNTVHCAFVNADVPLDYNLQDESPVREKRDADAVKKLLDPKGDFLAGEDTPVWLSYRPTPDDIDLAYEKLEKGIVKKAIDHWKSGEFTGISRSARSVDDNDNNAQIDREEAAALEIFKEYSSSTNDREKRQILGPWVHVVRPSILVLMSYETDWPGDKKAQEKLIYERILYALAFWTGVDLQLRRIDSPRVRLRIAGIVIGRNKEVTPRRWVSNFLWNMDYTESLVGMLDFWGDRVHKDFPKDFPKEAYSTVVTMTDSSPSWFKAVATTEPPCEFRKQMTLSGAIVKDDLAFDGLQRAVLKTAYTLGHPSDSPGILCRSKGHQAKRTWDPCDLKWIKSALVNYGLCLGDAREFHPPGKPVEAILPGKLMPASKQCVARGYEDGIVCWDEISCDYLYCENDSWYSSCSNTGAPVDGTTCAKGMMCLDAKCVSNTTFTYP